jgi:hypothetical protein
MPKADDFARLERQKKTALPAHDAKKWTILPAQNAKVDYFAGLECQRLTWGNACGRGRADVHQSAAQKPDHRSHGPPLPGKLLHNCQRNHKYHEITDINEHRKCQQNLLHT